MTDYLLSAAPHSPYFLTAADFDVLSLSGADSTRFLQGQLTCDVETMPAGSATPGAALTNKGRAYALFWLLKLDVETYVFVLNKGLGAVLTGQMRKYLPFYKCKFSDTLNGELLLSVGVSPEIATATSFALGADPLTTLFWLPSGTDLAPLTAEMTHGDAQRWLGDALLLGHFPFTADDVELYTPQELRLDQHAYVSYEKGCYTGQEIVARMHYRGKTKKQLCRLELDGLDSAVGLTLHGAAGEELGAIFKALPLGATRWRALAVLPAEVVDADTLPHPSAGRLLACLPL
jgi:folate-binding protein YgfZ